MTKIWAIVQANLLRTARDRQGLFFIVVLPMILIMVLGLAYAGGGEARVGYVDEDGGASAAELLQAITSDTETPIRLTAYASVEELRDAAARGFVEFGLAIPPGYDAALRAGGDSSVTFVAPATAVAGAVRSTVERAVSEQAAIFRAARFATAKGASFEAALAAARERAEHAPGVSVSVTSVAEAATANGVDLGAQSQVILFMFLTSLTASTELITTRQLGVSRRMFATPTGIWTIVIGEGLGRLAVALFQGLFIVVASAFLFGVTWSDPLGTALIVVVFATVCAGAALLVGTLASNASQAGAVGAGLGMIFGLIGGTMVPAEVFPDLMRTLSHVTPHAWALDAFRALLVEGGGLGAIIVPLAVLGGFGALLLAVSAARFRRVLLAGG